MVPEKKKEKEKEKKSNLTGAAVRVSAYVSERVAERTCLGYLGSLTSWSASIKAPPQWSLSAT